VTPRTDGTGYIDISFTGVDDAENDNCTWVTAGNKGDSELFIDQLIKGVGWDKISICQAKPNHHTQMPHHIIQRGNYRTDIFDEYNNYRYFDNSKCVKSKSAKSGDTIPIKCRGHDAN